MMAATPPVDTRPARFMTWFALIVVLATDATYVSLIRAQDGGAVDAFTVPFLVAYLVVMAALLGASLMRRWSAVVRMPLRAAAAGGLLVLGVLALFSIGLPLVMAGALATGATVRTLHGPHVTSSALSGVAAAMIAVAVLVGGFEVTERMIICPAHGALTGGGSGFLTGPYHYECVDGRLSYHSGSCSGATVAVDSSGHVSYSGC